MILSARDLMESSWHLSLLLLVYPPLLRQLLDHRWLRWLAALVIVGALIYHLRVAAGCHLDPRVCI